MSVKPVGELGGEPVEKTLAERIRDTQEEPWKRLDYVDDNSNEAWDTFEELFVETEGLPVLQAKIDNEGYLDAISAPRDEARLSRAKREVLAGVGE
jgi:DNA-directed RNA polymerase-3 subunit RPC5